MARNDRIAIVGSPGSGKTTFSRQLAAILNREVVHLDRLLWHPDWQFMPYQERRTIHDSIVNGDQWIIDGMWRSHVEERLARATTVIFLDYPRTISMWRAFTRFLKKRGTQRSDIADGCLEKLDNDFVSYIWNFNKKVRPYLLTLFNKYSENFHLIVLKSPKVAKEYMNLLREGKHNAN
jgi:adenylate kinase family enzyme